MRCERRDRRPNFCYFAVGVFNWSRKSYLGPTEIASCVFLVLFKDVRPKVSPKYFLNLFDVNQGKETG